MHWNSVTENKYYKEEKRMSSGKITQVIGPVVDVAFAAGDKLPEINNALVVYKNDEKKSKIVLEVALELGDGVVRTIAIGRAHV